MTCGLVTGVQTCALPICRRVIYGLLLVLLGKATNLDMPFAYKGEIDRMAPRMEPGVALAIALVLAYAGARFASILFDNIRNVAFERVGQEEIGRAHV